MEVLTMRDNVENEQSYKKKQEAILQESIQNPSPPPTTTSSPPSASASPTHEFSFTISLHPHPPQKSTQDGYKSGTYDDNDHNKYSPTMTPPPEPLTAIDLSPADDIFFHGHLLPLHLLSHLPISPRSSTNSMDSFTLPSKDILKDQHNPIGNTSFHYHHRNTFSDFNLPSNNVNPSRPKAKSFSLFGRHKGRKEVGDERERDHEERNNNNNSKKKMKLEVAQLIKRYMKMVRPLLSFPKARRPNSTECNIQPPHSFSGNLVSSRSSLPLQMKRGGGKNRGEFSAPASMRTSPANSGILLASGTVSPAKSTSSDSTMEELQAAIQAAIAHCKNSIAMEDKIQA
ncbi:hypothetical protein LXL04_008164 [Taraxacum kok-saghyz]